MGILDSKKEIAAMQEEINGLRSDVDRLKNLVLKIAEQVEAPDDKPEAVNGSDFGNTTFIYK